MEGDVIVNGGVDVRTLRMASSAGKYFDGGPPSGTVKLDGGRREAWTVSFINLESGFKEEFTFHDHMKIGRKCDEYSGTTKLNLPDNRVSRDHALIFAHEGNLYLRDEHSRNHTYLNGQEVTAPVMLGTGDVVTLGGCKLQIHITKA